LFQCISCSFTFVEADSVYAEAKRDTTIDYIIGYYLRDFPDTLQLFTFFFCPAGSECKVCVEPIASHFKGKKICKTYDFRNVNIMLKSHYYTPFHWIIFPLNEQDTFFRVVSNVVIRNMFLDTVIVSYDTTYVYLKKSNTTKWNI